MTPMESSIQAEYQDGFILDETEQGDVSLVNPGKNTFFDVLERTPEAEHGPMVRFSIFWQNERHDIDWTTLPENARPIRFRHGYAIQTGPRAGESGFFGADFGYQYNDEHGENIQEVQELR